MAEYFLYDYHLTILCLNNLLFKYLCSNESFFILNIFFKATFKLQALYERDLLVKVFKCPLASN